MKDEEMAMWPSSTWRCFSRKTRQANKTLRVFEAARNHQRISVETGGGRERGGAQRKLPDPGFKGTQGVGEVYLLYVS